MGVGEGTYKDYEKFLGGDLFCVILGYDCPYSIHLSKLIKV